MPARAIRVAAAQYPIDEITSFTAFEEKLSQWVQQAVAHGAQFLVFPEYGGMELARKNKSKHESSLWVLAAATGARLYGSSEWWDESRVEN